MRNRRKMPELNAGSMADIAFLLLIFFLVVTTIAEDKGIPVILPEYYEGPPGPAPSRDVLKIIVNADDNCFVENIAFDKKDINKIQQLIIDFVSNPNSDQDKPKSPENAIISLQNDVNTSYEVYVQVYSFIHGAYETLRNDLSQSLFQNDYFELSIAQKNEVLRNYPLKLSEADPYISNN